MKIIKEQRIEITPNIYYLVDGYFNNHPIGKFSVNNNFMVNEYNFVQHGWFKRYDRDELTIMDFVCNGQYYGYFFMGSEYKFLLI